MSYNLSMTVKNSSTKIVLAYLVTHTWNHSNKSAVSGQSLAKDQVSNATQITSGKLGKDQYSVLVQFAGSNDDFHTDFYCNASTGQDAVQIVINDDDCDCVYYTAGSEVDGCYSKG